MSLKVLYKAGALGAGADVWILPDFDQTTWTRSIDWYLNFQISKAKMFHPRSLSKDLKSLADDIPLKSYRPEEPAPLLVASSEFLPNRAVVKLPLKDAKEWTTKAYDIWQQLQKPSLRLFLPRTLRERDFESQWPEPVEIESIAVVPGI